MVNKVMWFVDDPENTEIVRVIQDIRRQVNFSSKIDYKDREDVVQYVLCKLVELAVDWHGQGRNNTLLEGYSAESFKMYISVISGNLIKNYYHKTRYLKKVVNGVRGFEKINVDSFDGDVHDFQSEINCDELNASNLGSYGFDEVFNLALNLKKEIDHVLHSKNAKGKERRSKEGINFLIEYFFGDDAEISGMKRIQDKEKYVAEKVGFHYEGYKTYIARFLKELEGKVVNILQSQRVDIAEDEIIYRALFDELKRLYESRVSTVEYSAEVSDE